MIIRTERLVLRAWRDSDFIAFASMHMDPAVMVDTPPLADLAECEPKFLRYQAAYHAHGFCRWLVAEPDGAFVGYTGIMPIRSGHPVGAGVELGWRLVRRTWGRGYATEAARGALKDGFERIGFPEVLSYTTPDNVRSQAVMGRLGLERRSERDFVDHSVSYWPMGGMVWVARPPLHIEGSRARVRRPL